MNSIIYFLLCLVVAAVYGLPYVQLGDHNERIIGGQVAAEGQFPYVVSFRHPIYDIHSCGGSIISKNFVVTAGSCCEFATLRWTYIVAGSNTLYEGQSVNYTVKQMTLHPDYNHENAELMNDICLLKLNEEVEFTDRVQPIKLSESLDDSPRNATIAGWGDIVGNAPTNDLQWLRTTIMPQQECIELWGSDAYYPIRENQICAITNKGEGACSRDSGGPLTTYDEDGTPILTGLVSWAGSYDSGYPDVYTKIGSFVDWINSIINAS